MPIERHNWAPCWSTDEFLCVSTFGNLSRKKTVHHTSSCGAIIRPTDMRNYRDWYDNVEMHCQELDRLWHEKYRPVAALCSLVEEADDSPA